MSDEQYFINTVIDIHIDPAPHDITNADSVKVIYCKPNGTSGEWTGVKFGSQIKYVTSPTDIDVAGTWTFQAAPVYNGVKKKGKKAYKTFSA
jgi:hypothetical protein